MPGPAWRSCAARSWSSCGDLDLLHIQARCRWLASHIPGARLAGHGGCRPSPRVRAAGGVRRPRAPLPASAGGMSRSPAGRAERRTFTGQFPPIRLERMSHLRLAAAQLNTVVGDLAGNVDRILGALAAAEAAGRRHLRRARAGHPRLPARGPPPQAHLRGRQRRRAREGGRRHRAVRHRGRLRGGHPRRARDCPMRRRSAPAAAWWGSTASASCPTTASSTSSAGSCPSTDDPDPLRRGGGVGGGLGVRGRVVSRWPRGRAGPRRRRRGGQPQRLALQPGPSTASG